MNMLAGACAALWTLLASTPLEAANPPAPAAPSASQPALPTAPHDLAPDAPLQPDYYAAAVAITGLQIDARFRSLRLQRHGRPHDPAFIVLPVQVQAWGIAPGTRALVGARLDRLLADRGLDASRQTDIVDMDGPFVRRLDETTIAEFAADHPHSTLIVLYVGRDAHGQAFVTLEKRAAGKPERVHERVPLPEKGARANPDAMGAVAVIEATLERQLGELGLGHPGSGSPPKPGRTGCVAGDWTLADPEPSPVARACHALLMGSLLPDVLGIVAVAQPNTPDRIAWLAEAWAQATPMGAATQSQSLSQSQSSSPSPQSSQASRQSSSSMSDIARLALIQLRVTEDLDPAPLTHSPDPVVGPLARLHQVADPETAGPRVSGTDHAVDVVTRSTEGMPAFARAAAIEQVRLPETFGNVDLCTLELSVRALPKPAECAGAEVPGAKHPQAPNAGTEALLGAWRLAAVYKALHYEGTVQGNADGFERLLAAIPPSLAHHPVIGEAIFTSWRSLPSTGGRDAYITRLRQRLADYAKTVATLQRQDAVQHHADYGLASERNRDIVDDPQLNKLVDDIQRLDSVVDMDQYGPLIAVLDVPLNSPVAALAPGSFAEASSAAVRARAVLLHKLPLFTPLRTGPPIVPVQGVAVASAGAGSLPSGNGMSMQPTRVTTMYDGASLPTQPLLEEQLARATSHQGADEMNLRVQLALVRLKHGEPLAKALETIDARHADTRPDWQVGETQAWAEAGAAFLYAGDLATAKRYFDKVAAIGTGSGSDLQAAVRLPMIAGDLRTARAAAAVRYQRYGGGYGMRDLAGLDIALGRTSDAWRTLLPEMQTSPDEGPWIAAFAGLRGDGVALAAVPEWLQKNHLDKLKLIREDARDRFLIDYALVDRLPTEADIAWLRTLAPIGGSPYPAPLAGPAAVLRMALDAPVPALGTGELARMYAMTPREERSAWQPFVDWSTWQLSKGTAPVLDIERRAGLDLGFARSISRAMILALDGDRAGALQSLNAARWELGRPTNAEDNLDPLRTGPYRYVLAGWMMSRKTGEPAYANEALALARAYQRAIPYLGWPFAAEALLATDANARMRAACRAQALDRGSYLLERSGVHPDVGSCAKLR